MADIDLENFASQFYKNVNAYTVIREAVVNSIHAKANEIKIYLEYALDVLGKRTHLSSITIEDNGEGFTKENLEAFNKVCTRHKELIGLSGKGVGRISYLKYAKYIEIESLADEELIKFVYNYDFDSNNVTDKEVKQSDSSYTKIKMTGLIKDINTQFTSICDKLREDVMLTLFLSKKDDSRKILIKIDSNKEDVSEYIINNEDIVPVATNDIKFNNNDFRIYTFKTDIKPGLFSYWCANRIVVSNKKLEVPIETLGYKFFIISDYFNEHVNMERTKFDWTTNNNLMWNLSNGEVTNIGKIELRDNLNLQCMKIFSGLEANIVTDLITKNRVEVEKIKEQYPYIPSSFYQANQSELSFNPKKSIEKYREREHATEEAIVNNNINDLNEISDFASRELAKYIFHRNFLIKKLKGLDKSSLEDEIHNLFIPKKAIENSENKLALKNRNMWLLDDKFMSYRSLYSDISLKKILKNEGEALKNLLDFGLKRPDISVFYSNDDKNLINKLVILEFKTLECSSKEIGSAIIQCAEYATALFENIKTTKEIYCFALVEMSDSMSKALKALGFKETFSNDERIMYLYNPNVEIPMHLYMLSLNSLLSDAETRNKTFMDILQEKIEFSEETKVPTN